MQAFSRQHGFTLIELLAASVVSALIAMVALTSVKSVTAGRERIDRYSLASDDLRHAMETIRKDLLNLNREADSAARIFAGSQMLLMQGDEERAFSTLRLRTISRTPARALQPEGEVYEVEYLVTGNEELPGEPLKLMRRIQPNPQDAVSRGGMLSVLCDPIRRFDAVYYDSSTKKWLGEWPAGRGDLPGMIKIKLTGATADGKYTLTRSAIIDLARWPQAPQDAGGEGGGGEDADGAGATGGGDGGGGDAGGNDDAGEGAPREANRRGGRGRGGDGGGPGGGRRGRPR